MRKVAILGGYRTPFVRSMTTYQRTTNQELLVPIFQRLIEKFSLKNKIVGDVAVGGVMIHPSDWNLAREVVLKTDLHPHTPAYNVQRACGTSLETTWQLALKISAGQMETAIAGGCDTNSDIAITFPRSFAWKMIELQTAKTVLQKLSVLFRLRPRDLFPQFPAVMEPRTKLSMGEHTERMVKEWKISRLDQDELALRSHQNADKAYREGFYDDLVVPFKGLTKDAFVRGDTTLEKLSKLRPAFDRSGQGSLTAGNSTPLTDGASCVLLASEDWAQQNQYPVLAYFKDAQVAAVDFVHGEGLLMAPTIAVSEMLKRNNLSLQDFDFYEIHEAFAGQVLCTLKAWESAEYCSRVLGRDKPMGSIDPAKMNVKGGSLALGHPFGATGARIVASLAKQLHEKGSGRGLISICTAGGMGVTAILER
ncbi:MAG: acetyl-CoA C-acyltransferase [Bdellovibrio sp. CG10_big_fil_rev_8_21_14_0_10_47_8]|nr:MAG: acetyl-CoA C-acyltransferase [Bdellovibrio sp. CG10_big_fil_rev_8_21_14_0_10_47_8]